LLRYFDLHVVILTPANAFPIASPVPDATGAITTAVTVGVIHISRFINIDVRDYREVLNTLSRIPLWSVPASRGFLGTRPQD